MTAALVDHQITEAETVPPAARPPAHAELRGATPSAPVAPRRPRPHLLPVPDCEPPLRAPQDDGDAPFPQQAPAAPFAGRSVGPRPLPAHDVPWRAAATTAPPMAHRRWSSAPAARRMPTAEPTPAAPRHIYSTTGTMPAADDTLRPMAAPPPEPPTAPRAEAFVTATVLARATIEALAGLRPIAQLRPHLCDGVFAGLQEFPMLGHRRDTQLVSLWVCEPAEGAAEVSAAFRCGPRTRALAMQLRAQGSTWFITSLQLG